jgi:hypothetical protein
MPMGHGLQTVLDVSLHNDLTPQPGMHGSQSRLYSTIGAGLAVLVASDAAGTGLSVARGHGSRHAGTSNGGGGRRGLCLG